MTIDVISYTNHESYNMPNNDIVIIELAEEVDLTTYTPACMAKTSDTTTFDGKKAWVYGEAGNNTIIIILNILYTIGWGNTKLTHGKQDFSDVLMELEVPVMAKETCIEFLADKVPPGFTIEDYNTDGMICAGGVAGEDSCYVSQIFVKYFLK